MKRVLTAIGQGFVFLGLCLTWPLWAGVLIWFILRDHDA